jgi:hypothetical protein
MEKKRDRKETKEQTNGRMRKVRKAQPGRGWALCPCARRGGKEVEGTR